METPLAISLGQVYTGLKLGTERLAKGQLYESRGRAPGVSSHIGSTGDDRVSMAQTQDEIKTKYQNVLTTIQRLNGSLKNMNMEGDRLLIRAEVANEDLKNEIWNAIKAIDPTYSDLHADIIINPGLTPPAQSSANQKQKKYTVQPGDSLLKIAQRFYGNANEYQRIFEANRDRLSDPDHIQQGAELVIPG
jgi:nucleoid-associated protein YgaU